MYHQHKKTFSDRVLSSTESFFQLISSYVLSQSPEDFVSIDSTVNDHTFILDDCSLISAFRVKGTKIAMKQNEFKTTVFRLEAAMKGYLSSGDTNFCWSFEQDTDKTREHLENVYGNKARDTATKIGFQQTNFVDEQVEVLAKYCHVESNLLVVRTSLQSLTKNELKELKQLINQTGSTTPVMKDAQNIVHGASFYLHRHEATLKSIMLDFDYAGIWVDLEKTHEYAYHLRNSYDSGFTDLSWRPTLIGDSYVARSPENASSDYSSYGIPRIKDQLIPRMVDRLTYTSLQLGDTFVCPFSVKYMPHKSTPFAALQASLKKEGIPFRMTFDISASNFSTIAWSVGLASLLSIIKHQDNKDITTTYDSLKDVQEAGGQFVGLRIHLCTWSRVSEKEAKKFREIIVKRLQSWGKVECESVEGDPVETLISSIPGLSRGKVAPSLPYELNETMQILPISRPTSVWETGSRILRTDDGKIFPTQAFSKQTNYWLKVILGPMGFGKSAELATDNFSLLLHPDFSELAYIRQIDVGPTSRGFIMYVKSLLPENQSHLAQYHRIQNSKEFQTNILDTLATLRRPISSQESYIRDLIVTLCLPDDKDKPYDGTYQAVKALLRTAYDRTSDRRFALRYREGVVPEVDKELARLEFEASRNIVFWWDVADFLYIKKSKHQMKAQQQAVPDLPYLAALTSDERLTNEFEELVTPLGMPLMRYIGNKLSAAMDDYPILSGRTTWNLDGAKIISLDLDDVTRGKGPAAMRQNTVFYNLASDILTRDLFIYEEQLAEIPETDGIYDVPCREIIATEIKRLKRLAKRFCVDELHRGGGIETFESMLETSALEGRKGGVDIVLSTQLVKAVPSSITELANHITILGAGSGQNVKECADKLFLDPSLVYILQNEMRSPNASGATSLNIFKTKRGDVQHKLVSTVSPGFLWRINSIQEDAYVRKELGRVLGEDTATSVLVERYPSGTIEKEIEALRKNRPTNDEDNSISILDTIVEDNIKYFKTRFVAS